VAEHFADRLLEAVEGKGSPAAVALDPVADRLPSELKGNSPAGSDLDPSAALESILRFGRRVIEIVAPLVPVIKINSAYFECLGPQGTRGYLELVHAARRAGTIVIGDVKRGDVGHSAQMYAQAHLGGAKIDGLDESIAPDAITVSGYFGADGVTPFIDAAKPRGQGVFVLVRTSNPTAADIQDIRAEDGRSMHEIVAGEVARWAADPATIGGLGMSSVGAVVATREREDAARLRSLLPRSILLVPGYGAQGGHAEDFAPYFDRSGRGALVAAGRSVIFAYEEESYRSRFGADWEKCIAAACEDFVRRIASVAQGRSSP